MTLSFNDPVACLEQTNLPPDITVQFTGTSRRHAALLDRRDDRSLLCLELYIKNKGHVHAALELVEVGRVCCARMLVSALTTYS